MVMSGLSEPLGADERVDEVGEEAGGHDTAERVIDDHRVLLEPVAGADIGDAEREEGDADGDEDHVEHGQNLWAMPK
jgi:hypothetical protein